MKKIFVAITTVALTFAPASAAFAETLSNVGNGVDSNNNVTVNENSATSVTQSNSATINNSISVISNTGHNSASRNTGGDSQVSTGDSGAKVKIENFANSNEAFVNDCCNVAGNTTVTNQGNGDSSYNDATLNSNKTTTLDQTNYADIANSVAVDSNTGFNKASRNTGGDSSIETGNSLVGPITINNSANQNKALVGAPTGAGAGAGSITLGNAGNGVDSDNDVTANLNNAVAVSQVNDASVLNWVDVHSNTGFNKASRNTGGDSMIDTGDSALAVALNTQVNSNLAAIANNCGCVGVGDVVVKNLGNGDSSDSDATLNKNNVSAALQANVSDVANAGYFDTNTGFNKADRNTGSVYAWSDPSIDTGTAYSNVGASTSANQNVLNSGVVSLGSWPTTGGNLNGNGYWWSWGWNANGSMSY